MQKFCWYKLAISESKNGWLKIENILALPDCGDEVINHFGKYKGNWVLAKEFKINIADLDVEPKYGVKLYEEPDSNSSMVFQSGKFLETDLVEVKGNWAKVSFTVNENQIIGWLQRKDQCAYPWTSCSYYKD